MQNDRGLREDAWYADPPRASVAVGVFKTLREQGVNYNGQFLYISSIAFDNTRIYVEEDVSKYPGIYVPIILMRYVES
jgi:hypothetical protein